MEIKELNEKLQQKHNEIIEMLKNAGYAIVTKDNEIIIV